MSNLLFVVVRAGNTRVELIRRLEPYFASLVVHSQCDQALAWLEHDLGFTPPKMAVVEWSVHCAHGHPEESLCLTLLRSVPGLNLLVICPDSVDTAFIAEALRPLGQTYRVISPDYLSMADLPVWLGLTDEHRVIQCGKLTLWPAEGRVFNSHTADLYATPEERGYPKLTPLRTRVLEYLMTTAQGNENRKKAQQIIDAVWAGRPNGAYSERSVHDVVYGLRAQIEVDRDHPKIIMGSRSRRGGYWISLD